MVQRVAAEVWRYERDVFVEEALLCLVRWLFSVWRAHVPNCLNATARRPAFESAVFLMYARVDTARGR